MTLARYVVQDHDAEKTRASAAEEAPTRLYEFWETKESSFKDWGVGIGLYFSTLRFFALVLFVGGCLSLRNIFYFYSSDYDPYERDSDGGFVSWVASPMSAVCTTHEWVQCQEDFCDTDRLTKMSVVYAKDENDTIFVQRSKCPVSDTNDNDVVKAGLWNLFTLVILMICTAAFSVFQKQQQTIMDEDKITVSDYSIRVMK